MCGIEGTYVDVHFSEDQWRIEDKNIQQNLNMVRKLAINLIKKHKISKIMFDCYTTKIPLAFPPKLVYRIERLKKRAERGRSGKRSALVFRCLGCCVL